MVESAPSSRVRLQDFEEAKTTVLKLFSEDEPLMAYEEL